MEIWHVALGAAALVLCFWFVVKTRISALSTMLRNAEMEKADAQAAHAAELEKNMGLRSDVARLESDLAHERKSAQEKIDLLGRATEEMRESFGALSADALKSNNASFLDLAKSTLEKFQSEAKGRLGSAPEGGGDPRRPPSGSRSRRWARRWKISKGPDGRPTARSPSKSNPSRAARKSFSRRRGIS